MTGQARRAVVLLSGGMDSATLLHYVSRREAVEGVVALSFAYGQRHARELAMAERQAAAAGAAWSCVDISFFGPLTAGGSVLTDATRAVPDLSALAAEELKQPPTYVPNRNMVLLSIAAAFAEARGIVDVYYGAQAQDRYGYWDCTQEFVDRLNAILALNRGEAVRVHAPFAGRSKADVLGTGLELGVDYGMTWTCYRGGEQPCRTCPSCRERAAAFDAAGCGDPLLGG